MPIRQFILAFCLFAVGVWQAQAANNEAVGAALKELIDQPSVSTGSEVADANFENIKAFYGTRSFKPVWSRDTGPKGKAKALLGELRSSAVHGLKPDFYNVDEISKLMQSLEPNDLARMDFLFTGALIDFSHDLFNGRTTNLGNLPSNRVQPVRMDPALLVEKAAYAGNLRVMLGELVGDDKRYLRLVSKLFELVQLQNSGHWPIEVDGKDMLQLRKLLALSGDLPARLMASNAGMDDLLVAAIGRFQKRHGLQADGKIGPATIKAMNVPLSARISQIQINLERRRWQNRPEAARSMYFNLIDGQLKLTVNDKTVGLIPVVQGKAIEALPTFYGSVVAIERAEKGGPIVLHYASDALAEGDDQRTIALDDSRGDALELLAKAVDDQDVQILSDLRTGAGKAELAQPVEIFVTYLTAWSTRKGQLNFRDDIFGRDARVAAELGL